VNEEGIFFPEPEPDPDPDPNPNPGTGDNGPTMEDNFILWLINLIVEFFKNLFGIK
jgi:hypothetical protein